MIKNFLNQIENALNCRFSNAVATPAFENRQSNHLPRLDGESNVAALSPLLAGIPGFLGRRRT